MMLASFGHPTQQNYVGASAVGKFCHHHHHHHQNYILQPLRVDTNVCTYYILQLLSLLIWSLHRLKKDSELHWLTIFSGKLFQVGMIEKKKENLTTSTLPNFGIIFFELEFLVLL